MVRFFHLTIAISLICMMAFVFHGKASARENSSEGIKKDNAYNKEKTSTKSPVLHVSPKEINLGVIGRGEGIRGNFILKNIGTGIVNWTANGSEGWSFLDEKKLAGVLKNNTDNLCVHISFLKDSEQNIEGTNTIQMSIEAGNHINIYRKQLSLGPHREMVKLVSNGSTKTIFVRFELVPGNSEPQIDVEPLRNDFGHVKPGENITKRIRVTNKGRDILQWLATVQDSASPEIPPVTGRYISFFNESIIGTGMYAVPLYLKEFIDMTGKWSEYKGFPLSYVPSNSIKYRFWGTGITVFFSTENGEGSIAAYVDEKHSINPECLAGKNEKAECKVIEGLPYGQHSLTVINQGGHILFEGVKVYGKEIKRVNPGSITIFPDSGTTTKEMDYINIMINAKHLEQGYYGDNIIFNSNGGKAVAEVSFEVSEDNGLKIIDVFRYVAGYDYLLTTNPQMDAMVINAKGYKKQGIAFRLFSPGMPGTTPLHRWYNAAKKDHFYSHDVHGEGKSLKGYHYEGAIGNIATSRLTNTRELYRWFNPSTGCHFYSTDPNGEAIMKKGYRFDGIAGYVR